MAFLIMVDVFFYIALRTGNFLSREILKSKSINQLDIFVANREIYFWNKLPNEINSNRV